jgi:hypothetical protein
MNLIILVAQFCLVRKKFRVQKDTSDIKICICIWFADKAELSQLVSLGSWPRWNRKVKSTLLYSWMVMEAFSRKFLVGLAKKIQFQTPMNVKIHLNTFASKWCL